MRQKITLTKNLIIKPNILLLNKPLNTLNTKIKQKIQILLKNLQQKLSLTFIFITHDQNKTLKLSNIITIIRENKIKQYNNPKNIYNYPINK